MKHLTASRLAAVVGLGLTMIPIIRSSGQSPGSWGDQADGTYANPIVPADVSDLDAIRVGDDFYAISSTFQYSPGMVVLHSKDLVNWQVTGHVVGDITLISPELNWDRMNRSGRGIWAGAIRYHGGRYWVYFGTPDEGLFMSTATNPAGPWLPVKRILPEAGWDDPCPFWDDDGQGYLVATHFGLERSTGKTYDIHLFSLAVNGDRLTPGFDRIIHQSQGSEANKLYKFDRRYYHFYSEVTPEGRVVMMGRARSLVGPWETKQLIHVNSLVDKEPNQGGLIELADKRWYFITHQGTGDWEGRAGVLLPVTWIKGWPIIGKLGADGIGNMVWQAPKPIAGYPVTSLSTRDDFSGELLKPEWEWNYQPRLGAWSLTERRGYLRLHAFRPLRDGDFESVGNVLTQRSMRTPRSEVTVKLDVAGLVSGQEVGIAHFAETYCTFGIEQNGNVRTLLFNNGHEKTRGPAIFRQTVWLRSTWDFAGHNQFAYSLDGSTFKGLGQPYQLSWGHYRGDRIGIFTFSRSNGKGYVDVDSFSYEIAR